MTHLCWLRCGGSTRATLIKTWYACWWPLRNKSCTTPRWSCSSLLESRHKSSNSSPPQSGKFLFWFHLWIKKIPIPLHPWTERFFIHLNLWNLWKKFRSVSALEREKLQSNPTPESKEFWSVSTTKFLALNRKRSDPSLPLNWIISNPSPLWIEKITFRLQRRVKKIYFISTPESIEFWTVSTLGTNDFWSISISTPQLNDF